MSSSDEEELLLLALVRNRKKRRRFWVHEINRKREQLGEFHRLCIELQDHEDRFFKYFRMSRACFEELHELIEPTIMKSTTNWRRPIHSRERLSICLRYLSTGDTHQTIAFSFRVGRSTVSEIVKEVCQQVWVVLQPLYLPTPSEEIWKRAVTGFEQVWDFPNCLGSIDGKHVRLKCPAKSGSNFFNYKHFFSIVLLAIVDPYYKFIVVDIGSYGRHSDSGIFECSTFYREFVHGKTILQPKPLPGTISPPIPHVFIGDEGFALQTYLMRPFPRATIAGMPKKQKFNQRLSRARRVVENAFGILAQKWRVFFRPIETDVNTAVHVVKATCCLHNYILRNSSELVAPEINNYEDQPPIRGLSDITPTNRRSHSAAFHVRERFADYFTNN